MSHETHEHNQEPGHEAKSKTSMRSSFWFVIIVVGLFIAALNFIKAESAGGEEGKEPVTEAAAHSEGHEGAQAEQAPTHEGMAAAPADTTHAATEAH